MNRRLHRLPRMAEASNKVGAVGSISHNRTVPVNRGRIREP